MAAIRASDEPRGLERAAYYSLLAFAASLQLSIAAAGVLLTITGVLWVVLIVVRRERIEVPRMFWPLAAYAGATLVSAAFSVDPRDQHHRLQAAAALLHRADRVPAGLAAAAR